MWASTVYLRDVVTLWVSSVFLSLLIANEGLQYWLFLSDSAYKFWGRVVVYLRTPFGLSPLLVAGGRALA